MAPGSKKNPKAKSKKLLSVDFKRVKSKVGRKLPPAQNATKVEFKAKGIVIAGQSVTKDKDGLAVNQRKQTLKELLGQLTHYSPRVRKDALMGLKDLFGKHPKELVMHAVVVIEKISPRVVDTEASVRQALVLLMRSSILPNLPQAMMKPLVPVIMAHLCSAMTHLVADIRLVAATISDLIVQHCSSLVLPLFTNQIVHQYASLLGKGDVGGQASGMLAGVLGSLERFLSSLKQWIVAQRSTESMASTVTHRWGLKPDPSHPNLEEGLQALHAYKSAPVEGKYWHFMLATKGVEGEKQLSSPGSQPVQSTGSPEHIFLISTQLVPVLLECWAEFAPMVCNTPNPDASSLDCLVITTRCLSQISQIMTINSSVGDMRTYTGAMYALKHGSDEREINMSILQDFVSGLRYHLLKWFPLSAPAVHLIPKVEKGLVAVNIGICQIMLQFALPNADENEKHRLDEVLEYFEGALGGLVLPSGELSEAVVAPKLAEPHYWSLVECIPALVTCISSDWVLRLLQAFTSLFESCNSRSNTKMVCLSSMRELLHPFPKLMRAIFLGPQQVALELLSQKNTLGLREDKSTVVPVEFQQRWLQSLPKLLWELKDSNINISQAVLEMLLYIVRLSTPGSSVAETYTRLQHAMVPFFCTFLHSKQSEESRCVYGPFVNLPRVCQELSTDLLYYYSTFSPLFLKVLAQCCLCPDLDVAVSVRIVEVLHKSFANGAVGLEEHLSFLFTLLVGRTSSEALVYQIAASQVSCLLGVTPPEAEPNVAKISGTDSSKIALTEHRTQGSSVHHEDLDLHIRQRHSAITGVACTCLAGAGDGSLVLSLLSPSIQKELEMQPRLRVVHGLFRAVVVLSNRSRRSDNSLLPVSLGRVLPKSAANFLVALSQLNDSIGASRKESALETLKRPCIILMARSPVFTVDVLKVIHEGLKEVNLLDSTQVKLTLTFLQILLELVKIERLDQSLLSSRDTVTAIVKRVEDLDDVHSSEGREIKRLNAQLQTASAALFGMNPTPK